MGRAWSRLRQVLKGELGQSSIFSHIMWGTKTSIAALNPLYVSTGLGSPVYAMIAMRSSTAGGCPQASFIPQFVRISGSYVGFRFRAISQTGNTQITLATITGSAVAFMWIAFELAGKT